MDRDRVRNWMWSEACEMLARAERLHREFFRPGAQSAQRPGLGAAGRYSRNRREVLVLVALPGVEPDNVQTAIDGNHSWWPARA